MPFDDTLFLKKNVDILSFFSEDQLRLVTGEIDHDTYKAGQTVMFQGELTNNFFVIKQGAVSVWAKKAGSKEKVELAQLKAGDFFGEMSLLESTTATATIKVVEDDTEILTIPHGAFQVLLKQNPLLENIIREKISARKKHKAELTAPAKEDEDPA